MGRKGKKGREMEVRRMTNGNEEKEFQMITRLNKMLQITTVHRNHSNVTTAAECE